MRSVKFCVLKTKLYFEITKNNQGAVSSCKMGASKYLLNFVVLTVVVSFFADTIYVAGQFEISFCKNISQCPKDNCCKKLIKNILFVSYTCQKLESLGAKCEAASSDRADNCACQSGLICQDGTCKSDPNATKSTAPSKTSSTSPSPTTPTATTSKPTKSCESTSDCSADECCLENSDDKRVCTPLATALDASCSANNNDVYYNSCPCISSLNCNRNSSRCEAPKSCTKQSDCDLNECCSKENGKTVCKKLAATGRQCSATAKGSDPYDMCPCGNYDKCEKASTGTANICKAPKKCTQQSECGANECCNADASGGACTKRAKLNFGCSNDTMATYRCPCEEGLQCLNGGSQLTCQAPGN